MKHGRIWLTSLALLQVCCGGSSRADANGPHGAGGASGAGAGPVGTGAAGTGTGGSGVPAGAGTSNEGSDAAGAGDECKANADCVDSPAAHQLDNVRCAARDIYCLRGTCHAGCLESCTVVRTDTDPCPAPRICVPKLGGKAFYCSIAPVSCESAADCPPALPPTSAETAEWECTKGLCEYPGFDYATH